MEITHSPHFTSFLPDSDLIQNLSSFAAISIKDKLIKALANNDINISKDLILEYLPKNKIDGFATWLAFGGILKIQKNPIDIIELLKKEKNFPLKKPQENDWIKQIVDDQKDYLEKCNASVDFQLSEATLEALQLIQQAKELISTHFPKFSLCIDTFISHLATVSGVDYYSSTPTKALGLVLLSTKPNWSLLNYAEALVHESAHIELTIRQFKDGYLKNPNTITTNPLRTDPRPLNGTFHASFVMSRTCYIFNSLKKMENLEEHSNKLFNEYYPKLGEALTVIQDHADFTNCGKALFESMKANFRDIEHPN